MVNAFNLVVDGSFLQPASIDAPATGVLNLSVANSGATILLHQATANTTINLPPLTAGVNFKFQSLSTANGANTITIVAPAGSLSGLLMGAVTQTAFAANTNLIYSATAANTKAGDYADIFCDGVNYWVRAGNGGTALGWSTT